MLRPMRTTRSRTHTSQPVLVAVALLVLMGLAGVAQPACRPALPNARADAARH